MNSINCIMIIDDDEISNFLIKRSLCSTKACKEIISFSNGKNALDYLNQLVNSEKELPSCILLDLNMPVLDGFGFLDEVNQLNNTIDWKRKIIVMSNTFIPRDVIVLEDLGFNKRMEKPIKAEALLGLI